MENIKFPLNSIQRRFLVLDKETPSTSKTPPTIFSSSGTVCEGRSTKKCSGTFKDSKPLAVQTVHSNQKMLRQTENNHRPVQTKHLHQVSSLQDADTQRCETVTSQRPLDCFSGPQGRLLARSNSTIQETLSRFRFLEQRVSLQNSSFRTKHCPQDIHKTYKLRSLSTDSKRCHHYGLSGRPSYSCRVSRKMSKRLRHDHKGTHIHGIDHKSKESRLVPQRPFQ